ncbi:hypothetical protein ABPG73_008541 [Tetrahymena malaccensis]
MDQYIQTKNKSLGKLSAATFLKNDSEIVEITDHDINNSKYLFEIKHCQPQILHQGDQDISCSSFNLGFNNIQQESHKDIHERNSFFCKNQQDEAAQIAVQHNLGKNPSSYQAQPKNDLMEEEQQIKICLNMNKNVQCESQEGILIEENFSQSNCKDANNWKNDEQAQTNYFFSKNTIIKSESKNQSSQNQSESKHFNHSQMKMNSQILIQDDIFYENDKKKLGTKVNYALKSQYQQKQQFNSTINYKQNFQKATNIIGRLLNSSMNREIEKSSKELNDDLVTIQRYLIRKNVSIQLKSRVRHYLSFLAQEQRDRDKLQEDKILFQLSNKLRDEITLEINSKILSNYNLFSSNFSKSTLNKLIFIMKEILVNPNEIIISEDKIDDSSIYFIQDGVIEIYQQQLQKQSQISIIQTLRDGQIFGDISFFTGLQRQASARSVNLSTLYKISRNEFIEILKENKEDFERFKMIQDSIIFQKGKSFIHNDCYYCKDSSHIASQCPRTHKQFDKQFIILKHNFSMFQERSNNRSNKKLKSNTKKQFKRNLEVIQRLRLSLQSQNNDLFSLYNDNQLSSYDTITESDNDNQEESVTESLVKSEIKEKEQNQKNNVKINEKEMIDQQTKNTLKLEKQKNEIEQQNNKQIYKCHSNLIIESYDPNKIAAKQFRSQARLRSLEATDNIDQANQESLNNVFNRQKSSQESNKISLKKDSDLNCVKMSDQQQQQIANQNEKDGSNLNNSKIFDKLKPHQQNLLPANAQISDQQKNQIKKMANLITINKQVGTQITSEEQNQSSNQDISYIKQNIKLENNIKVPANDQQSQSKKNSFLKYQNLVNQNPKEQRSSIDYQLQNIATLLYFHGKNMSQQQINNGIHCQQNNSSNNLDSNQSIIDEKDSISNSYTQKNNRLSFNKINHRENSQKTLQNQQSNEGCKKEIINEEKVIIERFSRILQNSQLPLLLQLTAGKSFLVGDSQFDQNPMDFFDKIQSFSKYYPDYNFDKIIRKLKSKQQKQKKLKRQATRERRQNVGLTKISIFQGNSKLVKIVPFSYDISLYQPTHLSYGTKIQKGTIYPINNFSKQII